MAHGTDHRAAVAYERVGDPVRSLGQQRHRPGQVAIALDVDVAHQRADDHVAVMARDRVQVGKAPDVEHEGRLGKPQLQQRDEALAARHHLGVVTAFGEDR